MRRILLFFCSLAIIVGACFLPSPHSQTTSFLPTPTTRIIPQKAGYSRVNGYDLTKGVTSMGNWGPIDTAYCGAGAGVPYGTSTDADTSFEFLVACHKARIRQHGTITRITYALTYLTDITAIYFTIWRRNGSGTYDVVGRCDVFDDAAYGLNTDTLSTPIEGVRPGDFYGWRFEFAGNGKASTQMKVVGTAGYETPEDTISVLYRKKNVAYDATAVDWEAITFASGNAIAKFIYMTDIYMSPPHLIFYGDSNMAPHKGGVGKQNFAFCEQVYWPGSVGGDSVNIDSTMADMFRDRTGYSYQIMAHGWNKVLNGLQRVKEDVIDLNPTAVVMNWGINDAEYGTPTHTFALRYEALIDSVLNNDIDVYIISLPPCGKFVATKSARRDSMNIVLENIVRKRDNCWWINSQEYIGIEWTGIGAPTRNLWLCASKCSQADSLHIAPYGQDQIARAIIEKGLKLMN